jgi:cytochrome P450
VSTVAEHPEVVIDPADPAFVADPYRAYAIAREIAPVFRQPGDHFWYLTRYADVHAAFRDKRLGRTFLHRYTPEELDLPPGIPTWRDPRWTEFQAFEQWELLNLEPPVHTRLRRLITEAFTPRAIEAMRDDIRQRARVLLEPGREAGSLELVGSYAQHFSLGIICDLIGVSPDDRETIKDLSDATITMYEPAPSDEQQARANRAAGEFRRYLLDVVAHRRDHPGEDLMTALIEATVEGERLTDDQVVSTAMVLLMAGHEATVNATSNGIAALAAHPDQWRRIRAGQIAPRTALEEILRFDPPLQWFERWVLEEGVEIAGIPVPLGTRLALVLGAANRDPRRYPDPDRFDISRAESSHLTFGGGIHFCIGAPLARMELEVTLTELASSEEVLALVEPAVRSPMFQFRGFSRLEIALHPRASSA